MSYFKKEKPTPAEPGRIHQFRGKPLAPFSWGAEATMYRLIGGKPTPFEEYTYTIFLLLTHTPAQMDALRTDEQISAFRLAAGEWADRENLRGPDGWKELSHLAETIIKERNEAAAIVPAPSPERTKKPGK